MSWILDIIVIAILGITVFFAARNGFIKTLISAASFAICIIVTAIFVSPLSQALQTTVIAENVKQTTTEHISNYILDDSLGGINDLLDGKSEGFNTLIRVAGYDQNDLKSWYSQNVRNGEDGSSVLAERISEPIVKLICIAVSVVILYFGTKILLLILTYILNQVAKLPVLHSCNKLLGVILGVLLAVVRICLFCFVVRILTENSLFINSSFIAGLDPNKTLIFRMFYDFDIFSFLKSLV